MAKPDETGRISFNLCGRKRSHATLFPALRFADFSRPVVCIQNQSVTHKPNYTGRTVAAGSLPASESGFQPPACPPQRPSRRRILKPAKTEKNRHTADFRRFRPINHQPSSIIHSQTGRNRTNPNRPISNHRIWLILTTIAAPFHNPTESDGLRRIATDCDGLRRIATETDHQRVAAEVTRLIFYQLSTINALFTIPIRALDHGL
jgi:hypothetical protein